MIVISQKDKLKIHNLFYKNRDILNRQLKTHSEKLGAFVSCKSQDITQVKS
jgi:hypothetical protein